MYEPRSPGARYPLREGHRRCIGVFMHLVGLGRLWFHAFGYGWFGRRFGRRFGSRCDGVRRGVRKSACCGGRFRGAAGCSACMCARPRCCFGLGSRCCFGLGSRCCFGLGSCRRWRYSYFSSRFAGSCSDVDTGDRQRVTVPSVNNYFAGRAQPPQHLGHRGTGRDPLQHRPCAGHVRSGH